MINFRTKILTSPWKSEERAFAKSGASIAVLRGGPGGLAGDGEGLTSPSFSSSDTIAARDNGLLLTLLTSAPSSSQSKMRSLRASLVTDWVVGAVVPLNSNLLICRRFLRRSQAAAPSRYHRIGYDRTS